MIPAHRQQRFKSMTERDPSLGDYLAARDSPQGLSPKENPLGDRRSAQEIAELQKEYGPLRRTSSGVLTHDFESERGEPYAQAHQGES